jgi:hypothetical protein
MQQPASTFLDCFTRANESLHNVIADLSEDELTREPHPSIGWLAWRLTRVQESNISRLWGREELWIGSGWAARFGMPPERGDFGRGLSHNREQVRVFRAPAELLLAYNDAAYELTRQYLEATPPEEFDRELNEPQYTPLPTVAVRIVSVVENVMHNMGQISYLKAYHRLGGWFPAEAKSPREYR